MCSGSKSKPFALNSNMEIKSSTHRCSVLLELSASDDLIGFRNEIEVMGSDIDETSYWYGRRVGSKKMSFEERTPLLIAAMYGSINVLKYIIGTSTVDVDSCFGSDKVSALHCAVAGSSKSMVEIIKLLLDASADPNCMDSNGNKPIDLFGMSLKSNSKRKLVELLLKGESLSEHQEEKLILMSQPVKEGEYKKEYPMDVSLPDINNGIYGTVEFRMFCFKVKPCSRAYSHDWTECPFVHPGENARRRDPKKFPYSCVPCPDFRKGSCLKGDNCEYAHGVFESWLHPAQYRTRLCKDETGCPRKVCFFAHKTEELRPVYASTGSAMPSPKSMDMAALSSLTLGSSPPMSPLAAAMSSPTSGNMWQNKVSLTPPALQLPGSRLKTTMSARDFDLELELKRFNRMAEVKPSNLDDVCGLLDPSLLSPLHGMSMKPSTPTRQNMNQLCSSYPGFDSSAAVMNSRSSAFSNRSQSFIDRGTLPNRLGVTAAMNSVLMMSSNLSGWSSPDGKLDWGVQGGELNKLRKSASFGFRSNNSPPRVGVEEPDVSWVNSLVKDARDPMPLWMEQMNIEQEQMVA